MKIIFIGTPEESAKCLEEVSKIFEVIFVYTKEDKISYVMFQKNKLNYMSLNLLWDGDKRGGDIASLKILADKTVFSNNISINSKDNEFELQGGSSDIISYLLQMAENDLIQKFTISVLHLESGRFNLIVRENKT